MYQQSSGAINELVYQPGDDRAAVTAISNSGIITGWVDPAVTSADGSTQFMAPVPVVWTTTGGAVELNGRPGQASAVNAGGTIVGYYDAPGHAGSAAAEWSSPTAAQTVLPALECDHCPFPLDSANAINNAGTVAGVSLSTDGPRAVVWQSGTVTSLGSFEDSGYSQALGINNSGDVVGSAQTAQPPTYTNQDGFSHAFLYHQGVMTDLGTLVGDTDSYASSINDKGQIIGTSSHSYNSGRAFLYQNGQIYDLNTLLDPTSALAGSIELKQAVSINSRGWIVANGADTRDQFTHAFLLIPSQ